MARYLISYLDGESEIVTAANLEPAGGQYIAWVGDGSAAAYIPSANVRSIVLQPEARLELRVGDRIVNGEVSS